MQNQILKWLIFGASASTTFSAGAAKLIDKNLEDNPQQIVVTGARLFGSDTFYNASIVIVPSSFTGVTQPFRKSVDASDYLEWIETIQLAKLDPLNTTDIRCSAIATPATRQTSSLSDNTMRFMAAQQLFTAINAYKGALGIRAAIAISRPEVYAGKMHATFTVTYIDGGTEKWVVAPGLAPTLIVDANLPPPPSGDGQAKPCPATGNG